MANNFYSNQEEGMTRSSILLRYYSKILDLSACELTGGYWHKQYSPNNPTPKETYIPSTREVYINAIDSMALALYPDFDKEMTEFFSKHEKFVESEKSKYRNDEGFFRGENKSKFLITVQDSYRLLFRELTKLLHRLDFFKGVSFVEGADEGGWEE